MKITEGALKPVRAAEETADGEASSFIEQMQLLDEFISI